MSEREGNNKWSFKFYVYRFIEQLQKTISDNITYYFEQVYSKCREKNRSMLTCLSACQKMYRSLVCESKAFLIESNKVFVLLAILHHASNDVKIDNAL